MATNAEIEMRWIDAWNDVYDIVGGRWDVKCQLPDWSVVDVKTCLGWLQDSAYEGYLLTVSEGWIEGRRGVIVSRRMPDPGDE